MLGSWLTDRFYPQPTPPAASAKPAVSNGVAGTPAPVAQAKPSGRPLDVALKDARLPIETPRLKGSIALTGARIDDLVMLDHRETVEKGSAPVRLLSPMGTPFGYFAGFGWTGNGVTAPGPDTVWKASGAKLTPETPVTLSWSNEQGQDFSIKLAVDENYLFTAEQSISNHGTDAVSVQGNGFISRSFGLRDASTLPPGTRPEIDSWTLHIGPIGTFNGATNYKIKYDGLDTAPASGERFSTKGGWLGFGDNYWLTALVPGNDAQVDAGFRKGGGSYQADFATAPIIVAPGKAASSTTRLFAGAKDVAILRDYERDSGIATFTNAVDWGWFSFVVKPMYFALHYLFQFAGNFGIAIILLTFIVKLLLFPIAQKQFSSMAKMRVLQPKMKAIQERFKDDKLKQQQEIMALYQKEKVNPASGCLPIFIQIPIFYGLYKVLMLSVEMRHQPFFGWLRDLSAPDPLFHLLLPGIAAHLPSLLTLGLLPILLGITMHLQMKLNPTQMAPEQEQVMKIMPWVMMFLFASFGAGLQLYYVVNNTLTILQQKWLYSKYPMPVEPAKA